MTFADKVKYVRATLQLSQKQLAEKLGVTYVSISRWETQGVEPQFLIMSRFNSFCKENGIDFDKAGK